MKDSARLAISEMQTDSDSGENRYLAVPCSRNTGTKTMQMQSVESTVGTATSPQPTMIAWVERIAFMHDGARCFR